MQPGDTITPGDKTEKEVETNIPPVESPNVAEPAPETPAIQNKSTAEPSPWQYSQHSSVESEETDLSPIDWTASEFVDHEKDMSWFMGFAVLTGLAVAIIYIVTREFITAIVIVITASLFAVSAKRKPQTLHYQMDRSGITIGNRTYPYDAFKSFSVLEEGAFSSIQLSPLKRFAIPISLYYTPEDEDKIINMLGSFLPHEVRNHDPVDRLMRKVRF